MAFNELNSVDHNIIHQISGVDLSAGENIEAKTARSKALQKIIINQIL